jgi:hypothetical protein
MKRVVPLLAIGLVALIAVFALLRLDRAPDAPAGVPESIPPPSGKTPSASSAPPQADPAMPAPGDEPRRKRHRRRGAASGPSTNQKDQAAEEGARADGEGPQAPREPTVWPTSAEGIAGAMKEALPGIRRCYEQALAQDPTMAGTIAVTFTIGTTDTAPGLGQVLEAGIQEATIQQTTMDGCLLEAMEALQFDPPVDGETEVIYPFVFSQG